MHDKVCRIMVKEKQTRSNSKLEGKLVTFHKQKRQLVKGKPSRLLYKKAFARPISCYLEDKFDILVGSKIAGELLLKKQRLTEMSRKEILLYSTNKSKFVLTDFGPSNSRGSYFQGASDFALQ